MTGMRNVKDTLVEIFVYILSSIVGNVLIPECFRQGELCMGKYKQNWIMSNLYYYLQGTYKLNQVIIHRLRKLWDKKPWL